MVVILLFLKVTSKTLRLMEGKEEAYNHCLLVVVILVLLQVTYKTLNFVEGKEEAYYHCLFIGGYHSTAPQSDILNSLK